MYSCSSIEEPCEYSSFWECHHRQSYTSDKVEQILIGSWNLDYSSNCEIGRSNLTQAVQISFHSSNDGVLSTPDKELKFSWKVTTIDSNFIGIETIPSIIEASGRLLICDGKIMFNNSYVDGLDHFFSKVISNE